MAFLMKDQLDRLDRSILSALHQDARVSWRDLASQVGVSPPTVRDRINRLQDRGIIEGFYVGLSPTALGYTLQAIVRFKPLPGKRHLLEAEIQSADAIVQCDKVTGEDGYVARVLLRDIAALDPFLEPFAHLASTHTALVKSSPVTMRQPSLP